MSSASSTGARHETCKFDLDDGGDATMFALWGARVDAGETLFTPTNEEEEVFVATLNRFLKGASGLPSQGRFRPSRGRFGRNHHRRSSPV